MKIRKQVLVKNTDQIVSVSTAGYNKTVSCEVVDSNLPNPVITSVMQDAIRLSFDPRCLNHTVVLIFHYDVQKEEKPMLSMSGKDILKSLGRGALYAVISALVGYVGNFAYKNLYLDESVFWGSRQKIEYKFHVGSNDKTYYDSDKIRQLEEDHKSSFSLPKSYKIKNLFHYTEKGVYIMIDVARHSDGDTSIVASREQASEYCSDMFDGRILKEEEYSKYVLTNAIQSLKSPFKKAKNTTEWTSETHPDDSDYYKILTKNLVVEGENIIKVNGFTYGEEESVGAGYRCAMFDEDWEDSENKK